MAKRRLIRDYAEGCEAIYGEGGVKDHCDAWFAREFPGGHAQSIRPFLEQCVDSIESGAVFEKGTNGYALNEIHPRAFRLLIDYGVDYTPFAWDLERVRSSSLQPLPGQCFVNSYRMMEAANSQGPEFAGEKMVYVEGVAIGALVPPMLHAWNAYGHAGTVAHDWSHYLGSRWSRYLGIPFTLEEHYELCSKVHPRKWKPVRLLHLTTFPKVEAHIQELLAARRAQDAAAHT